MVKYLASLPLSLSRAHYKHTYTQFWSYHSSMMFQCIWVFLKTQNTQLTAGRREENLNDENLFPFEHFPKSNPLNCRERKTQQHHGIGDLLIVFVYWMVWMHLKRITFHSRCSLFSGKSFLVALVSQEKITYFCVRFSFTPKS